MSPEVASVYLLISTNAIAAMMRYIKSGFIFGFMAVSI